MRKVLAELEFIVKSPIKLVVENESAYDEERRRHNSAKDSGAEVSDSEDEEKNDPRMNQLASEGEQLVERILLTLKKVCSLLFLSQNTDLKHIQIFTNLLDICLNREVYNIHHKELMASWRHKIFSIWG